MTLVFGPLFLAPVVVTASCNFHKSLINVSFVQWNRYKTNYALLVADTRQICCKYAPAYRFHHDRSHQSGLLTGENVENGILCRYAVFILRHITQP